MLTLNLVTPEKKIETGLALDSISLPGFQGELNILEKHAALVTTLETGMIKYRPKGQPEKFVAVSWGYCEVFDNVINVLAETAETPNEIDFDRAKATLADANLKLAKGDFTQGPFEKWSGKSKRAEVRLQLFDKKKL